MKISEEILPVVIKKIKIGKKFLTKSMIEQIPWGVFIYYFDEEWHKRYGVPGIFDDDGKLIGSDDNAPYNSDGNLIGYIEIKTNPSFNEYVKRYNKKNDFYPEEIIWNCEGKEYFIIWYDNENNLKRGYIDKWTANVAGVKLEQIYI